MCHKCSNKLKEIGVEELMNHIKCPKYNSNYLNLDINWIFVYSSIYKKISRRENNEKFQLVMDKICTTRK